MAGAAEGGTAPPPTGTSLPKRFPAFSAICKGKGGGMGVNERGPLGRNWIPRPAGTSLPKRFPPLFGPFAKEKGGKWGGMDGSRWVGTGPSLRRRPRSPNGPPPFSLHLPRKRGGGKWEGNGRGPLRGELDTPPAGTPLPKRVPPLSFHLQKKGGEIEAKWARSAGGGTGPPPAGTSLPKRLPPFSLHLQRKKIENGV